MYYLNYSVVVNAYTNLLVGRENQIDSGIIGTLFLMKNSQYTGEISPSYRIPVDESRVTHDINHLFSFVEPVTTPLNPETFFILSEGYDDLIFDILHGSKVDILSLACILLQSEGFDSELNSTQLIQHFIEQFHLPSALVEKCFESSLSPIVLQFVEELETVRNRKIHLEASFPNPDNKATISFKENNGSNWQTSLGGDFGRGAYTQKMRPSSNLKELIFLPNGTFQRQLSYEGQQIRSHINTSSLNVLYFGPSGTGKSTEARRELIDEKGVDSQRNLTQVTFHPEYTYSDFVGSLKPITLFKTLDGSSVFDTVNATEAKYIDLEPVVEFKFEAGPFVEACLKAANSEPSEPHALIIDEINRGNVPEIMGDIFQLLDREEANKSNSNSELQKYIKEHSQTDIFDRGLVIPSNLYIYATINPADQNVYPLDTAFKRRWKRRYWKINSKHESCVDWELFICGKRVSWPKFLDLINKHITHKLFLSEDKQLGHFFIKYSDSPTLNEVKEETLKVISYLWEDIPKSKRKQVFGSGIFSFSEIHDLLLSTESITKLFAKNIADELIQISEEMETEELTLSEESVIAQVEE